MVSKILPLFECTSEWAFSWRLSTCHTSASAQGYQCCHTSASAHGYQCFIKLTLIHRSQLLVFTFWIFASSLIPSPVLISNKQYLTECPKDTEDLHDIDSSCERIVTPMKWGITPPWHSGDPYKVPYETNNCRVEGMMEKKTYKVPLHKGQRCVVLMDGWVFCDFLNFSYLAMDLS